MKCQITAIFVIFSLAASAGTLRVASLNVNAGISSSSNAVAVIRNSGADIVCLQEPNPHMMTGLTNALADDYPHSHVARPGHDYWYYIDRLGILSKYPFEAVLIAPTAEGSFGSQLAVVHVGESKVQLLNVHLAPPRLLSREFPLRSLQEFAESEAKRVAELKDLLSKLNPDLPTIVAGDFNALPGSPTTGIMLSHGFTDTHRGTTNAPAVPTWSGDVEGMPLSIRLDYIFCDDSFAAVTNAVIPCASSDHSLVFTELIIKKRNKPTMHLEPISGSQ